MLLFPLPIVVESPSCFAIRFSYEALTAPDNLFAQIVHIIEEGGWAVFRNMPLIFSAVGLPIESGETGAGPRLSGGADRLPDRNYFINAMGMTWPLLL